MNSKRDNWKVWKLFTVATVTAIFIASLSKAVQAIETQSRTNLTIDERLAKVRERLQQRDKQIQQESNLETSVKDYKSGKDESLQAQWYDWNNWGDGPWSNWSDAPWSNWSDWTNQ